MTSESGRQSDSETVEIISISRFAFMNECGGAIKQEAKLSLG